MLTATIADAIVAVVIGDLKWFLRETAFSVYEISGWCNLLYTCFRSLFLREL